MGASWSGFAVPLFAVGGILLATGIVGWCPAYTLFGMSTVKTPDRPCLPCETERDHV